MNRERIDTKPCKNDTYNPIESSNLAFPPFQANFPEELVIIQTLVYRQGMQQEIFRKAGMGYWGKCGYLKKRGYLISTCAGIPLGREITY